MRWATELSHWTGKVYNGLETGQPTCTLEYVLRLLEYYIRHENICKEREANE